MPGRMRLQWKYCERARRIVVIGVSAKSYHYVSARSSVLPEAAEAGASSEAAATNYRHAGVVA